jgi:hypothetical protein
MVTSKPISVMEKVGVVASDENWSFPNCNWKPGWPDWANFRSMGDRYFWLYFENFTS